ncbi:MAG: glycosyl transferase, partial [Tepidimonas sp.]
VLSVYRKWVRGQSPSVADALHFHQLVYRRLVRGVFHDDQARRLLMRNNRTSPYLLAVALVAIVPAIIFWWNTPVLVTWFVLFMIAYVGAYLAMVRFKVPKWLRR